jgi:hypothetical protein
MYQKIKGQIILFLTHCFKKAKWQPCDKNRDDRGGGGRGVQNCLKSRDVIFGSSEFVAGSVLSNWLMKKYNRNVYFS